MKRTFDYSVGFTVPGEPKGKARPVFSRRQGYVKAVTPEQTVLYENLIKLQYAQQCKNHKFDDDAELLVEIVAYYPIPKSTSKKKRELMLAGVIRPTKKPDADNVAKVYCDALNGIAYKDDTQIVELTVAKYYSDTPRVCMAIVSIRRDQNDDKQ